MLLGIYRYATFSWMYLLAGVFKETGMAFIVYVCVNLFFGINTIITHSVVFLLSQEKATDQVGTPVIIPSLEWNNRRLLNEFGGFDQVLSSWLFSRYFWLTKQRTSCRLQGLICWRCESHTNPVCVDLLPQQRWTWWWQREEYNKRGQKLPLLRKAGGRGCLIWGWWELKLLLNSCSANLRVTTRFHCAEYEVCCVKPSSGCLSSRSVMQSPSPWKHRKWLWDSDDSCKSSLVLNRDGPGNLE